MRIVFVGVSRRFQDLPEDYWESFIRYHLELPWYYAAVGNDVILTTKDLWTGFSAGQGTVHCVPEERLSEFKDIDVVVHWRKWFPELYVPGAWNVINCQDHSFSEEWKRAISVACMTNNNHLDGILCFPTWHKRNLQRELSTLTLGEKRESFFVDGLTLGVDTDIYYPSRKDPYQLLWASDPGRGMMGAIQLFLELFRRDRRYRLHVCYPDYVPPQFSMTHPGVIWHGNVQNGEKLWKLFRECGILPYTSTFMEPSSRAHRQAMAAGSLVLYPPGMGSPSELIEDRKTGIVSSPDTWADIIHELVKSGDWKKIGQNAREYAVSENWHVQANRFTEHFRNRGKR